MIYLLLFVLFALSLGAYNLLCTALFRARVDNCRLQLVQQPLRCYLMGLLTLSAQVALLLYLPVVGVLALALQVMWLSQSLPALTGLAGEGLGLSPRWSALWGSLPLCFALVCPLLGWFGVSQMVLAALGSASLPRVWRLA